MEAGGKMSNELREVVIIDAVRTPVGRAKKGVLIKVRPDDLGALVVRELVRRTGIDASLVEDAVIGCAMTEGEQGMNVARTVTLLADMPVSMAATTVNRFCGSALQSINQCAASIAFGAGDVMIAGGIESMTFIPMGGLHPERSLNIALMEKAQGKPAAFTMIQTAQYISEAYNISKDEQDKFALESHKKATAAAEAGKFVDEIIPVPLKKKTAQDGTPFYEYVRIETLDENTRKKLYDAAKNSKGQVVVPVDGDLVAFANDECPRKDTTLERIASLQPVSQPFDTSKPAVITAANSSPLNDGAAAVLLMTKEKAKELGLKPLATIRSFAVAGVEPYEMGIGPSKAIPKALERAGLKISDIDLVEINEAFGAVVLTNVAILKKSGIDIDMNKVNVNGGAVAIGHPLGVSGSRIMATLTHEMKRRGARYGLESLCVGGGQGIATIVEREA